MDLNEVQAGLIFDLQQKSPQTKLDFWQMVAGLDSAVFYATVLIVFILLNRSKLNIRGWILLGLAAAYAPFLKSLFDLPRPAFYLAEVDLLKVGADKGFPSGAAISSVIAGQLMSYGRLSKIKILLAFVFPLVVGISRFMVGAHFIQDILAGWIFGWIYAVFFISFGFKRFF